MKIGIVTGPYLNRTDTSMGRYTNSLIENLLKINEEHDIYLIHSQKSDNSLHVSQPELSIPELSLPLPYGIKTFHLPFLLRKHKFDVVHYPAGMPFFSWMTNSKNITTLHSVDSLILPQYYPKTSQVTWLAKKPDYKRLESIITVSESEKNEIAKVLKIPREKIKVVYHGLDSENFKVLNDAETIKKELHKTYGTGLFILQVANYISPRRIFRDS
jgi:glycosyltransferase involved in cell wall biosynthesis